MQKGNSSTFSSEGCIILRTTVDEPAISIKGFIIRSESSKYEKNLLTSSINFMSIFLNENALSCSNSCGKMHL